MHRVLPIFKHFLNVFEGVVHILYYIIRLRDDYYQKSKYNWTSDNAL